MNTSRLISSLHLVQTILLGAMVSIVPCAAHAAAKRSEYHISLIRVWPGGNSVQPFSMNNHGHVVGRAGNTNGIGKPFVYRNGRMRELPIGDGPFTSTGEAIDINDAGEIVAMATVSNFYRGFYIRGKTIIDLDEQSGFNISPKAINKSGVIAGTTSYGAPVQALTWHKGETRLLGFLDSNNGSTAVGINKRGTVLGYLYVPDPINPNWGGYAPVIFRGTNYSFLPISGEAINDRGDISGRSTNGLPALLRNGVVTELGLLPGDHRGWTTDINNHGDIVGVSEGPEEAYHAVLYRDGTLHRINDLLGRNSGWDIFFARSINDRGQILAVGIYLGEERACILTPVRKKNDKHRKHDIGLKKPLSKSPSDGRDQ